MIATCPCGFVAPAGVSPISAEFHQRHRDVHLAAFPNVDEATRANLNLLVRLAVRGAFREPAAPAEVLS